MYNTLFLFIYSIFAYPSNLNTSRIHLIVLVTAEEKTTVTGVVQRRHGSTQETHHDQDEGMITS